MVLMNHQIETEEGITDEKSQRKRKQVRAKELEQLQLNGEHMNSLVLNWKRATQRCLQFIRWLRHCLENQTPWRESVSLLRPLMHLCRIIYTNFSHRSVNIFLARPCYGGVILICSKFMRL